MREFSCIYNEFQPKIFRYLCRIAGDAVAADLTQTVFLKVNQSLQDFRGDASVGTWIYRIATNVARDHAVSSLAKQRSSEITFEDAGCVETLADRSAGADDQFLRREMSACIRGILDQLPTSYRTVLLLTEYEELSNAEVAEVLGISLQNTKIRLHRARLAMRKAMERQCSFYRDERNELQCDRRSDC